MKRLNITWVTSFVLAFIVSFKMVIKQNKALNDYEKSTKNIKNRTLFTFQDIQKAVKKDLNIEIVGCLERTFNKVDIYVDDITRKEEIEKYLKKKTPAIQHLTVKKV